MKRTPEDDDEKALGRAARKARTEPDGRLAAAVELAIDTDDDLDPTETEVGAGVNDDDVDADADKDAEDGRVVPQEALIRRRIRRMKELKRLYQDQYWRLLEDLRRRHYRFQLRNGHGGRKDEAAAAAQEREKAGLAAQVLAVKDDGHQAPRREHQGVEEKGEAEPEGLGHEPPDDGGDRARAFIHTIDQPHRA